MIKKYKKTGTIIGIIGSSVLLLVAVLFMILFASIPESPVDLSGIYVSLIISIIISILSIIFCSLDLASTSQRPKMSSLIFVMLNLSFAIFLNNLVSLAGIYGYIYPLLMVFLFYSCFMLHKGIFSASEDQKNLQTDPLNDEKHTEEDFLQKMEELYQLKERGVLSEEEYNQKKSEIISKL